VSVRPLKIVLTGGPGGGKTSAADLIARELPERIVTLRETASILFAGGFPRSGGPASVRACQRAIFRTQVELEAAVGAAHPGSVLLCDRGTVDGAAYWPDGPELFFTELGTTLEHEVGRYDAVLFFESAASAGRDLDRRNPFRIETGAEAARLDTALRTLWAGHPRLRLIEHRPSFLAKVAAALAAVRELIQEASP
jgi:hypothetical protein